MQTVADSYHLKCRNGIWYYRRRVPQKLVPMFKRQVIQFSLNTVDKAEAKRRRSLEDVVWDARFRAAVPDVSSSHVPDRSPNAMPDLTELVRRYVERTDRNLRLRLSEQPPADLEDLLDRRQDAEMELSVLLTPGDPRQDEWISSTWDQIEVAEETKIGDRGVVRDEFATLVRRALIEIQRRKLARYDNNYDRTFYDTLFDPVIRSGTSFGRLCDQYLATRLEESDANSDSEKSKDKLKSQVALVRELIGDETPVSLVDYDACQRARSKLARIPANRTKLYPLIDLDGAIRRGEEQDKPRLSPTTQARYLDTLQNILSLATRRKLIPDNPAIGLRPMQRSRLSDAEKRLPFTPEQIVRFFNSGFYRSCASGSPKPYQKADRTWRFWMPLICLFMGMRHNEVCQLTVDNVCKTNGGTWYLEVDAPVDGSEDAVMKSVKTATSRRKVPIHPELIEIGLLDLYRRRRKNRDFDPWLLPGLKPDRYGNRASYALRRFRETFLPAAIELEARQAFYSFRHSFRDALRRCDAPPATLQAIGGWSQGALTSDSYGDKFDPDHQRRWIEKVKFPGLELGFLYGAEK